MSVVTDISKISVLLKLRLIIKYTTFAFETFFWYFVKQSQTFSCFHGRLNGFFQIALQTAGVVSGLPYAFIILLLCKSVWTEVKVAAGDLDPDEPKFSTGVLDPIGAQPYRILAKRPTEALELFSNFLQNIIKAPFTVAVSASRLEGQKDKLRYYIFPVTTSFALAILFHLLELAASGCWAIGCFWYLSFAVSVTGVRLNVRKKFQIDGNIFEDFFASLFFYPCVAVQLDAATKTISN